MRLANARLSYGERALWDVDVEVRPGEFLAILGPNGSGKTSLLKVLLGQQRLTAGSAEISGRPVVRGNPDVGYIPQQRSLDLRTPLRARDLVKMGVDGASWGPGWPRRRIRERVEELLDAVGALPYADAPVGLLSGGEQQRLRVAQALASDPSVLLCDEPLLSLDLRHQRVVSSLIDKRRREHNTAVLFVTHEINPILNIVDRVLYLVGGRFRIGPPEDVMTTESLSELYGTRVEVFRAGGRLVIVGADDNHPHHEDRDPA